MKEIFVGDAHLGKFKDISIFEQFWYDFLKPMCDDGTSLFLSGDQFDEDEDMDAKFLDSVINVFMDISKTVDQVYFIVGNHDTHLRKDISVNMNCIFKPFVNFNVITFSIEPLTLCNGSNIHFLSYEENIEKLESRISDLKGDKDYLLCHADIKDLIFDNGSPIEYGIEADKFSEFKRVLNGHIHRRQELKNITNLGSPYQMKFSDSNNQVGVHVLGEDGCFSFIENKVSPRYIKIKFKDLISIDPNTLNNKHVWVTEVEHLDSANEILDKANIVSKRLKFINMDDDSDEEEKSSFEFDYKSDPIEETPTFLDKLETIVYQNVNINLDKEKKTKITKKVKAL